MVVTNQTDNTISIVTVCDSHYLVLLAALVESIKVNHHSNESIDFYIVYDNIISKKRVLFEKSLLNSTIRIIWIKMADAIPSAIAVPSDNSSFPINIYMRIFIPYFIPAQLRKVLYLDVDMIVLEDISKLWVTDLKDYPVAAVLDMRVKDFKNAWGGIRNFKELGLDGEAPYFNTGLLLINVDQWRALNVSDTFIECVRENKKFLNYPDQYGLNVVLSRNWLQLDRRWNLFSDTKEKIKPFVIHFIGRKPIYSTYYSNSEFKDIFFQYLNQSGWKFSGPIGETRRFWKKLKNILSKLLA